jgi:hypothetical protein
MALLTVLKVTVPAKAPATGNKDYYFQGGNVYADTAVAAATGISVVADFENDEPLCSIEQLVLSKKIMRFVCELSGTNTAGQKVRKTASIYSSREKASTLLSGNTLNGKDFKVKRGTVERSLGKIEDIRTATRDSFN